MTDRDPLRAIATRQRRDIGLLFETLGDAVSNAASRQTRQDATGRAITEADRVAIMREVDAGLAVIFGRFRGDPDAALRTLVLRDTRAARALPLETAVKGWRDVLGRGALRERVEDDALGSGR